MPNEIEAEHWRLINAFIGAIAKREGVRLDPENGFRIMREHWHFIADKDNLKADVELKELEDLEAAALESQAALDELNAEITRRKRG